MFINDRPDFAPLGKAFFINTAGLPMWVAFLLTCLVAMVLLGYTFKRAMVDPLIRHGVIPLVIATLGLSIGIKQTVKATLGAGANPFASPFPGGQLTLAGINVSYADLGTLFLAGLNYWQQHEGNYWGHNAVIRVQPFIDHCALPELPG